jgi:hypothetical protein
MNSAQQTFAFLDEPGSAVRGVGAGANLGQSPATRGASSLATSIRPARNTRTATHTGG